jgi:hypothetical protein
LSDAESIVQLAEQRYWFGRSPGDLLFAVPVHGPKIATMLRGSSDALRAKLAREFRAVHGRTASSTALTDAMTVLQGIALDADLEPLGLRVAEHEGNIVIDLGGPDGRAVVVSPGRAAGVVVAPQPAPGRVVVQPAPPGGVAVTPGARVVVRPR